MRVKDDKRERVEDKQHRNLQFILIKFPCLDRMSDKFSDSTLHNM